MVDLRKNRKLPTQLYLRQLGLRLNKVQSDVKVLADIMKYLLTLFTSMNTQTKKEIEEFNRVLEIIKYNEKEKK